MKRVHIGWKTGVYTAQKHRPIEELSWHIRSGDLSSARTVIMEVDDEECSYVGEGEGMGTSFSTIAEALAFSEFQGDEVINRSEALVEHARRRGWSRP